jgi:hypothetical protein
MNKTLTALAITGALALTACSEKPVSKIVVPESSSQTKTVFRMDLLNPRSGVVMGYDTDNNPRTIEEAVVVRNRTYGMMSPGPVDLEMLPRADWNHYIVAGAEPKRLVTDNMSVMTSEQQAQFNQMAALANYK